jgi:NADPH:quinone reductase-like Zn-dependent oxidoreductase
MRAVFQVGHGAPTDVLEIRDAPDPTPGPEEVVVAIEAAPLHGLDVRDCVDPARIPAAALPRVPGIEGVGRVVACGSAVSDLALGDRVVPPMRLGYLRDHMLAPAAQCLKVDGTADPLQLSLISSLGMTAALLVDDHAGDGSGRWLLHNGANAVIARFVQQIATARGWNVVGVVRRPEAAEGLGGAIVVDPGTSAGLAAAVLKATGGAEIHLAFDVVGGDAGGRLPRCLATNAVLVLYGAMSGEPCRIPFIDMGRKGLQVLGMSKSRSLARRSVAERRALLSALAAWSARGVLRAPILGTYGLADIAAAYVRTADSAGGKVIVVP